MKCKCSSNMFAIYYKLLIIYLLDTWNSLPHIIKMLFGRINKPKALIYFAALHGVKD